MNAQEKLLRIQSLLSAREKEENVFELKIRNLNNEIYSKRINPLLINFLNLSQVTAIKLNEHLNKLGGRFTNIDITITRQQIKEAYESLTEGPPPSFQLSFQPRPGEDFFDIIGAEKLAKISDDLNDYCDFLEKMEEYLNNASFNKKHKDASFKDLIFNTHLKAVTDQTIIDVLEMPFSSTGLKIHGIWKILGHVPEIDEPSLLLGHCTRNHTNCWPIILDGLKMSKAHGGRCGAGIYFSNDISKCLGYSSTCNIAGHNYGAVFLAQVFLGKVSKNTDGKRPDGYDSVHAMGTVSPALTKTIFHDDSTSSQLYVDSPKDTGIRSAFHNNEFVIYDERRCRLRFIVLYTHGEKEFKKW